MTEPGVYEVGLVWQGEFQGHLISDKLPGVKVAAMSKFRGPEDFWTPEHLFVAAVSSCFMTTFVILAEESQLEITALTIVAKGKLERVAGVGKIISEIVLTPHVVIATGESPERALRIMEKAERNCFISNSILTTVKLEPEVNVLEMTTRTELCAGLTIE